MLLLIIGLAASPVTAQWPQDADLDRRIQRSVNLIYDLKFEEAELELAEVVRQRPDHPAGHFFVAMVQWWRILSNFSSTSQDEKFYDLLDRVIEICDRRLAKDDKDVTALFFKGGAVGFRGRLRANRGKWVGAANDGVVALPLVRKAYALDPKNADVLLGIGIYHYYAEVIPDRYPIVKPLMVFFPSGDRALGLKQLEEASQRAVYARTEAKYFLMQNMYMFEKDFGRALTLAQELHEEYPKNPLFHRYLGRCYVANGRLAAANEIFAEVDRRYVTGQRGYDAYDGREAAYYLGRRDFIAGSYDTALKHFYRCDEMSRTLDREGPSGFMVMANLQIGMIYDLQGKRTYATRQYQKVLGMKDYEGAHSSVRNYLKKPYGTPP
ncbi:MAG: tetratricopeptide repeat protein [Bacteroidetes bacterium]|nr:tetratricopeptide repeat protein [Bacteroidota bacterium]